MCWIIDHLCAADILCIFLPERNKNIHNLLLTNSKCMENRSIITKADVLLFASELTSSALYRGKNTLTCACFTASAVYTFIPKI